MLAFVIKKPASLSAAILPLALVFGVYYLKLQSKAWAIGPAGDLGQTETATLLGANEAEAVAGASTSSNPGDQGDQGPNLGGVTPETYQAPITAADSQQFLQSQNITLFPEDVIKSFPNLNLGVGGQVMVYRAQAVLVHDGNHDQLLHTWQPSVGEALSEGQIELGDKDQISLSLDSPVLTSQRLVPVEVTITRVEETNVVVKEKIAYQTVTKNDNTLEKGVKQVTQKGVNGVKALTYLVRRENGVEVSRKLVDTEVEQTAQNEIVVVGTKVKVYGTGSATWYTKQLNHVAANNNLPRGTKVKVVNLNNGKSTIVTVVGGGLYTDAAIDLSYDAFAEIGDPAAGRLAVRLEKVYE